MGRRHDSLSLMFRWSLLPLASAYGYNRQMYSGLVKREGIGGRMGEHVKDAVAQSHGRIAYYDNVKFVLIVLVVVGHVIDMCAISHPGAKSLFVFIYSFHMPLFLFISGLFLSRERLTGQKTLERVVQMVALGFLLKVLLFATYFVIAVIQGGDTSAVKFTLLGDGGIPWYLFALAAFYTLSWILRRVNVWVVLVGALVLGMLVGYDSSISDYLYLSRIMVFLPFFWLGHMLNPARVERALAYPWLRVVGVVVIVAFAVLCLVRVGDAYHFRPLFTGRNSFENAIKAGLVGCSWMHRGVAYVISATMCASVLAVVPRRRIALVSEFGTRTLAVYMLHFPVLCALHVCDAYGFLMAHGISWPFVCIGLGVIITVVLSFPVFSKPFSWLGSQLRGVAHVSAGVRTTAA